MSRSRRENRDAAKALSQVIEVPKMATGKKTYTFVVPTPMGPTKLMIPHEAMKVCPCGSALFKILHHVTFVKNKADLSSDPICFKVEVNVCDKCGREVTADDASIGELQNEEKENGAAPKSSLIIE